MKTNDDVVVTGLGFLTPLGDDLGGIEAALCAGKSAAAALPGHDYSSLPARFGGAVSRERLESYGLCRIRFKLMNDYVKFGVIATRNALEDAGLLTEEGFDERYPEVRRGVFVSSGVNGDNAEGLFEAFSVSSDEDRSAQMRKFTSEGIDLVHPRWILGSISNNLIFYLTSEFGLRGDNNNVSYDAAGGCYMLDAALEALRCGACDMAVVTGSDSVINWQAIDDLDKSGVIDVDGTGGTRSTMAPYTAKAGGMLPGEGAAAIVLERADRARARGAKVYAAVLDTWQFASGSDLVDPSPGGEETAEVLGHLLDSGADRKGRLLLNLNGMAVPSWDRAELAGLASCADRRDSGPIICTASKPYFCHSFSAAFVIDAAVTALALHRGFTFPIPEAPDLPEAPASFCKAADNEANALGIALGQGFGGNTGGILFARL